MASGDGVNGAGGNVAQILFCTFAEQGLSLLIALQGDIIQTPSSPHYWKGR